MRSNPSFVWTAAKLRTFAALRVAGRSISIAVLHRPSRSHALILSGLACAVGVVGAWGSLTFSTAIGAFLAFFAMGATAFALPIAGLYLVRVVLLRRSAKRTN